MWQEGGLWGALACGGWGRKMCPWVIRLWLPRGLRVGTAALVGGLDSGMAPKAPKRISCRKAWRVVPGTLQRTETLAPWPSRVSIKSCQQLYHRPGDAPSTPTPPLNQQGGPRAGFLPLGTAGLWAGVCPPRMVGNL